MLLFRFFPINTRLSKLIRHSTSSTQSAHTHTHTKEKLFIKRSIINAYCTIKKLKMSTITFVVTRVLLISLLQTTVVEGLASPPPARLKQLLQSEMDGTRESDKPILLPCCYDGLTARLVARAGFDATFMTGFGVSAVNGACENGILLYSNLVALRSAVICPIIRITILLERALKMSSPLSLPIVIIIVINFFIQPNCFFSFLSDFLLLLLLLLWLLNRLSRYTTCFLW